MKEILNKISTRNTLTQVDYQHLQSTVEKFPWYSFAHHFLARAAFQQNKKEFALIINKAALYSPNREKLFDFITTMPSATESTAKTESKSEEQGRIKPQYESKTQNQTEIEGSEIKKVETPIESLPEELVIESESLNQPEESEQTVEYQSSEKKEEPVRLTNIVEQETPQPIKPLTNENGEEITSREQLRETVRQELQRIEEERKKSFVFSKDQAEQVAANQSETPINPHKDKSKIVEEFIKNKPSIQPPADGPYDDTLRLAKESLEEHYDFVSETLAEIYFKQNNPEKAKKIYEQLILKLPEKKLYFAARIKEIEDNSKI
ncbi:MAG: tetratricopeptide repeat protein [Bacteroidales bacterium]|nr:tetratricopeptide repeat protein [Bacteroidales bacterium]